jgi:hypothetical protein
MQICKVKRWLLGAVLGLVPVAGAAAQDISGAWTAVWSNNNRNDLVLGYSGGQQLTGTYVNDAKAACAVTGNVLDGVKRFVLTVRCPHWDLLMEGVVAGDGRTAKGSYRAYGNATGPFTMVRR